MELKIKKFLGGKKGKKPAEDSKKLPKRVWPAFESRGIDPTGILAFEAMDMDKEGNYSNPWLAFDKEKLYIVYGNDIVSAKKGKGGSIDATYTVTGFEEYPVADFDSLMVERFVSTGRLLGLKKKPSAEPEAKDDSPKEEAKDKAPSEPPSPPHGGSGGPPPGGPGGFGGPPPFMRGGFGGGSRPADDQEITELACFSLGAANRLERICGLFAAFKEGKEPDEESGAASETCCPKCGMQYPNPNRKVCPKCVDKRSLLVRLLGFFKFYYKQVIVFFLFMVISALFGVLSPYVGTKLLYDNVLVDSGVPWLGIDLYKKVTFVILLIFGMRVLSLLLNIAQGYATAKIVPYMVYDLKLKIFTAMQKLSLGFYTSKQTGFLMQRVTQDASQVYWFFVDGVPYMLINLVTFIGILVIMLLMNWQLTVLVLIAVPFMFLCWRRFGPRFRRMHHAVWTKRSRMVSHLSDTMGGQRVIKAFAKEDEESARFGVYSGDTMRADVRVANTADTVFPVMGLLPTLAHMVILALGGVMIVKGNYGGMTFGKLMLFTSYMNMLYQPINFFARLINWFTRCMDAAQRIFEVIDAVPDVLEAENPVRLPEMKGDIVMKDVMFEYEPGRPVLRNLSLDVKAGHMVGVVGKTGAGKTTLVNLIARLYDTKEGSITIDGVNVRDIAFEDMKHNIGIVSQEIYLFIGSIADNIRYARPDATMEEVIAAAKAASAHDFIMRLPDGYQTRVGSGGQDLSGGEKQRLSIARTIIQNPKILILDEATASMDTETERHIQESLTQLKEGRTTIAIAHRLSTLRDADVLCVIDNGEMKEYGTHDELIKLKGIYYKLYMLQFEALKHIAISE